MIATRNTFARVILVPEISGWGLRFNHISLYEATTSLLQQYEIARTRVRGVMVEDRLKTTYWTDCI